jgi:flagellar assembly protein FliH
MASRIISRDDAQQADRWDAPSVDASAADALSGARGGHAHLLTARQLDDLQRHVQEEAHARGFEQGLNEGRAEMQRRGRQFGVLLDALAHPFHDLDEAVEQELNEVAIALASHLMRRELERDSAQMTVAVRDCLAVLPSGSRNLTLHLHPADAVLVREALPDDASRAWRLEEDAGLERGDLRVQSDSTQIDGRIETRLREIVAIATSEAGADTSV